MAENDGDTWYCFYAVMKLRWEPSRFAFLSPQERALMYVFIDERIAQEKKANNKLKSAKGGRHK